MRFTPTFVLSTLCCTIQCVYASTAHVYTYDPQSPDRINVKSRTLSPVQARLVLAQRAGVEDYHVLHPSDLEDQDLIDAINDFGARTPFFADEKSDIKKAFIFLEGDNSETSMSSLKSFSGFQLTPVPRVTSSRDLFVDLVKESDPHSFLKLSDADLLALLKKDDTKSINGDLFHIAQSSSELSALFTNLAESKKWDITALIVPSDSVSSSTASWGTYLMPGAQSPLKKRQTSSSSQETPLTVPGFSAVQSSASLLQASSTPLKGILPSCFASQSECESTTRNCTGHGSCSRKYHDSKSSVKGGYTCYSCACQPSKSEDGLSTTYWAGPACQKKDVSMEFWLIALFTVGLVGLISFAVGSVWEMGSQPLPSVIGAGVSGTGARK